MPTEASFPYAWQQSAIPDCPSSRNGTFHYVIFCCSRTSLHTQWSCAGSVRRQFQFRLVKGSSIRSTDTRMIRRSDVFFTPETASHACFLIPAWFPVPDRHLPESLRPADQTGHFSYLPETGRIPTACSIIWKEQGYKTVICDLIPTERESDRNPPSFGLRRGKRAGIH